ncbi:uncharacterized protein LOC129773963 [Toxorhynchites rutilus septentrionalis]|uniref:uncharacterized protein LOC129773963 n=1 Tax=Toxorhynchites rutilus septentrionalis TaxID=329112 RepID=UPI002479F5FA|nr:uncharacterized protein LOC129773963 [Toxorhynchites rutilus septentrionalis]
MLINLIERFKIIMPCGILELGVPVMVPLKLNHTNFTIDQHGWIQFDAELNNILIEDLDKFDIVDVNLKILQFQLDFNLFFHSIKTTGEYKAHGKAFGLIPFNRSGSFTFNLIGLHLDGTIKIGMNSDQVMINDFKIRLTVDLVESKFEEVFLFPLNTLIFNKIIEGLVPKLLKDYQQQVSQHLENFIKPQVNEILRGYTVQELGSLVENSSILLTSCSR